MVYCPHYWSFVINLGNPLVLGATLCYVDQREVVIVTHIPFIVRVENSEDQWVQESELVDHEWHTKMSSKEQASTKVKEARGIYKYRVLEQGSQAPRVMETVVRKMLGSLFNRWINLSRTYYIFIAIQTISFNRVISSRYELNSTIEISKIFEHKLEDLSSLSVKDLNKSNVRAGYLSITFA